MNIKSEQEMLSFGKKFAKQITPPVVIELIGDVGTGKTTFTRGLAQGLNIKEPVTSPSFTISMLFLMVVILFIMIFIAFPTLDLCLKICKKT